MVKKGVFLLLRISLLPLILRLIVQRGKITVIYYHNIEAAIFEKHIQVLKRKYSIISLQDYIYNNFIIKKGSIIITFDDGYKENYKLLPHLEKHQIPITIFITAGLVDTNRQLWFLIETLEKAKKNDLKKISNTDRLKELKEKYNYDLQKEYNERTILSTIEIQRMLKFTDIQSHTVNHPCLHMCSDNESFLEISESKQRLEKITGKEVNAIAFPNGDYTMREIDLANKAGYKSILTSEYGYNFANERILKRISTNDTNDINELVVRVSGAWALIKKIQKKITNGRI